MSSEIESIFKQFFRGIPLFSKLRNMEERIEKFKKLTSGNNRGNWLIYVPLVSPDELFILDI